LRILYVSHSFPVRGKPLSNVGGMQRVAVDLHAALLAHPRVRLETLALETSWKWTGVRTAPFLLSLVRGIPEIVRREQIQVVLFSSMVTASILPLIRGQLSEAGTITAAIPVGRDLTLPNAVYQRFVRSVLPELDLVLPISRATAGTALERGASPSRVKVVPCGVDFDRFPTTGSLSERRSAAMRYLSEAGFAVPEKATRLLSVGRHQERKGFHWFAGEVVPRLGPNVVYLVAGEGPMTAAIRNAAEAAGVGDRVLLLGQVTNAALSTLLAGSDLFIMPNIPVQGDIEGFGVVMLEAGAAGLPVIAANLEGIRDVVSPGENGWLVDAGDAPAFAARIEGYFAGVPDEPRIRAAAHVRANFGWPAIVDRFLALFEERVSLT